MGSQERLNAILADLAAAGDRHDVSLGELVSALETRGFGPLLMLLAGLLILPTGMIPGVPAAVGCAMIMVAVQMLLFKPHPWLPRMLRDFRISARLVRRSIEHARPVLRHLGWLLGARATALTDSPLALRAVAFTVMAVGLILIPLGFIPFLPFVLAVNVFCFGLALTVRNGLLTIIGFAGFAPGLWLAARGLL